MSKAYIRLKLMNKPALSDLGLWIACVSFITATIIFLLYFLTLESDYLMYGFISILIGGLINALMLLSLLIHSFFRKESRSKSILASAMILANIPLVLFYCWGANVLSNTVRLTLVNETETDITDIKIHGCESKCVNKLRAYDSETVWLSISDKCAISVEYVWKGEPIHDTVDNNIFPGYGKYCVAMMGRWD